MGNYSGFGIYQDLSGGSGTITGSGTTNTIPIFTGATALGDSEITWDGESFTASLLSGFFRFDDGSTYIQIFPNVATISTNDSYLILEGNKGVQLGSNSTATWESGALSLLAPMGAGLLEIRSSSGEIEFTESGGGLQKISFAGGVGAYTYTLPSATGTIALDVTGGYLPLSGGTMTGAIDMDGSAVIFSTGDQIQVGGSGNLVVTSDKGINLKVGATAQTVVSTGTLTYFNSDGKVVTLDPPTAGSPIFRLSADDFLTAFGGSIAFPSTYTASRQWDMPDASGTVALTSDIPTPSLRNVSATDTFATANEIINCTANTFTVNLPTAVGIQGTAYTLVNSGTGTITLDGNGTETINDSLTIDLVQYVSRTVQSDGTDWIII